MNVASFSTRVGVRYLFSKKGDFLVSIITVISVIGVALGVMALLVVMSVLSGFESDFRGKILGNNAHMIVVKPGERRFAGYQELVEKMQQVPNVVGASPFVYSEVLLHGKSNRSTGVLLHGVDPGRVGSVTSLRDDMVEGSVDALAPDLSDKGTDVGEFSDGSNEITSIADSNRLPGIIVGEEVANQTLFLLPGDVVEVLSPTGELTPFGMSPKMRRFRVVGIFKSGLYEYDSRSAYVHIREAQKFFNSGERANGIQIKLSDAEDAMKMSGIVEEVLGEPFVARTWMELNRDLFSAFKLEKTVFFIVLTMIILVAAFNIIGTLILLVTEKAREIAILKAIGATQGFIMRIFMVTGCAIGMVGTGIGLILAYIMIVLLRDHVKFPLNANVYQVDRLPVSVTWTDFAMVAAAAVIISFVATVYPSLKAARLHPVEGLRYE